MSNTVRCSNCESEVEPERELGLRGSWDTTLRIDLECPDCGEYLGNLPNPSHSENDVSPEELEQNFQEYFSPSE